MKNRKRLVFGIAGAIVLSGALLANVVKKDNPKTNIDASALMPLGDANVSKVLYVDAQGAMQLSTPGIALRQEAEQKQASMIEQLQSAVKGYEQAKIAYSNKASTLGVAARDNEEKKLIKMERELKLKEQELKEEFQVTFGRKTDALTKDLMVAAQKLGEQAGVDAVIDIKSGTVLWVRESKNYTTQLVQVINNQASATVVAKNSTNKGAAKVA